MTLILKNSRIEIKNAEESYLLLFNAQTFSQAEKAWLDFLGALERVWQKTEYNMQKNSRYKGWRGKYISLRRNDELLAYLKNARDAKEHTISEVAGIKFSESGMAKLGIRGVDGNVTNLWNFPSMKKFLEQSELTNDTVVHVEPEEKNMIKADLMKLNIVHNRGISYSPPTKHLNKELHDTDSLSIAKLGLEFYKEFVKEVEATFFNEER